MKFLYRLTIKSRLVISTLIFFGILVCIFSMVWFSFQNFTAISTDNLNIELANSQIQKTIRSLNEYVISGGTESPMLTVLSTSSKFEATCRRITRGNGPSIFSTQIEHQVLAPWVEVKSLMMAFFKFDNVDLDNDEAMIVMGRILSKSESLMAALEQIRNASLRLLENVKQKALIQSMVMFTALLCFLLVSHYFTYKSILNPISKLARFSRSVSQGKLDQQIQYEATDELSNLAESFNKMAKNLSATLVSKSFLDSVIESMPESVIFADENFVIQMANQSCLTLLAYKKKDLVGQPLKLILANSSTAGGTEKNGETRFKAKDGSEIPVRFSRSTVHDNKTNTDKLVYVAIDIRNQKAMEEKLRKNESHLRYLAHHDSLTNLPNRLLFHDRLKQATGLADRSGKKVAILILDLDQFKKINDSLGHAYGDKLLCKVAERFKILLRHTDTVARFGGDEFAIIMPEFNNMNQVLNLAKKIIDALEDAFQIENHILHISASIGISVFPDDGRDDETLLSCADVAMYQAKKYSKENPCFYSAKMNARSRELLSLENDLRRALKAQEFYLDYQPQLNLTSGSVVGFEALLRWKHPEKGLISPGDFIPMAEENGLIVSIGEWALRSACLKWVSIQKIAPNIRMAVNISARQFQNPGFFERVKQIIIETGITPEALELELTESLLMEDVENAIELLSNLKALGVQLAIDDFGTGFSSLSYLKLFPVDRLKIDRSFVIDMIENSNDAAIVNSVIALTKSMNLHVIAEGIETEEQVRFLQKNGCNEGQGFLFSRPLSADNLNDCFTREFSNKIVNSF